MTNAEAGALTSFQVQVAQLFFSLPTSAGFLLAGGAALAAQHLTARPTQDLDIFTGPGRGDLTAARDAFERAVRERSWTVRRVRDSASFCRLVVSGPEDLLVDLALDAPPHEPTAMSAAGPTFGLEELAGRKLIALFDRAEARDFVDVYALARRFPKPVLLTHAAAVDTGFDRLVLAEMVDTLSRFTDAELPVAESDIADLRRFFAEWATELRTSH